MGGMYVLGIKFKEVIRNLKVKMNSILKNL